ncbi:MAG: hypothetical protein IJ011_10465 [Clostridia bacterium]|nr:hypothetical protein [Clostridia bacterium]
MVFSTDYTTRWHDTDAERNVRPSAVLVYMQETSNKHLAESGMSLDTLRDEKGLAFILSKIRIAFHRPLHAFEDIHVETFTCPSRGYSSLRGYRILSGGEVVAEADTTWALLDIKERQLRRMEETGYVFDDEPALSLNVPSRTRAAADIEMVELGNRHIVYSDLDYNMHMNNTHYPDMLCDFLPIEKVGHIKGMTLSYLHEAAFGDTVNVFRGEKDGTYYFRTVNGEGVICLEAVVVTE